MHNPSSETSSPSTSQYINAITPPPIPTCEQSHYTKASVIAIHSAIAIGAYFGVSLRIILTLFSEYPLSFHTNQLIQSLGTAYFLSNLVGCFVMGLSASMHERISELQYTFLTTALCGCLTTYSSWNVHVVKAFVQGSYADAILLLLVQYSSAMAAYIGGLHAGKAFFSQSTLEISSSSESSLKKLSAMEFPQADLDNLITALRNVMNACKALEETPAKLFPCISDITWLVLNLIVTLCILVLFCVFVSSRSVSARLLSIAVAPLGAYLRYYLSKRNRKNAFPLYTFLPNIFATYLGCSLEVLRSFYMMRNKDMRYFEVYGDGAFQVGFLGSLSTVSTWIHEAYRMEMKHALWYVFATLISTQVVSVLILSSEHMAT